jgi:uncharacterized membrane protein YeaQ/YmgE (transglycosylase-associated protein family)
MGAILAVIFSGFLIGGAARWIVPGPDPMPFWLTVLIGLFGSMVGGGIAAAAFGSSNPFDSSGHAFVTLLLEIAAATALVAAYRRFVQQRPLSGAEAYRFPTRGFGVQRMRTRLRQLGVDPDKLAQPGTPTAPQPVAEEARTLAQLRELHDKGVLTDEEYERARERLERD